MLKYLLISFVTVALQVRAQQQQPPQPASPGQSAPGQPGGQGQSPVPLPSPTPETAPSSAGAVAVPARSPQPREPYVIEDGGFSIEPIYWLNRAQPILRGGSQATQPNQGLDYPGNSKHAYGGQISIPAGAQNTLRFSYFRVQGNSTSTAKTGLDLFGEGYNAGDFLAAGYRLQNYKLSWDYLGYTWYKGQSKVRLKTLYELQYSTISTTIDAPYKPITTDSSGNADLNEATGSKNLIYPTLGLELEQAFGKHFRWEAKGSGFGLPHRSNIWDVEASIAARIGQIEIMAGEKAFHLKTSAKAEQYFADTLSGAYVGIRYYWGHQ